MSEHSPQDAPQLPEGFRRVKRWRVALKIWALVTAVMGTVFTAVIIGLLHALRAPYSPLVVPLAVFAVVGFCNVPLLLRVVREYPVPFRWK